MNETVKIAIVALIASVIGGFVAGWIGGNQSASFGATGTRMPNGISTDTTSPSAGEVRTTTLTTTGTLTLNGTTTLQRSYDGFMAGGGIAPASVATGTVHTLYTHAGGRALCNAAGSAFYADSTAYSPTLIVSVGTSTSAAYSNNLIASTTIATTTDKVAASAGSFLFVMEAGDKITAFIADGITNASSTYFANWDIEYALPCWLIGG